MRYILYVRKSSEPEDRQMSSIDDQVFEMKRLAAQRNLHIIDVISEAKSAKRPGRPGFTDMIKRFERGEADGILCWKLNRLARNPVDGGQISWLLQQRTIKHIQTYSSAYTPDDNVLNMQVEFGIANQFIKDLKADVERGMKRKAERGWYPTKPPVGYKAVSNKIRQLHEDEIIPDPERFPIVRKLWELLLTNSYSMPALKKEADRLGLRKRNGTQYSLNAFHKLFSNVFYTGRFMWTPFNGIKTSYEGNHVPMVTWSEFHKAQAIIHRRGDVRQRVNSFPYRGMITCGECQGSVTAEQKLQAICTNCKLKFSIITKKHCPRCKTNLSDMKNPSMIDIVYYRCAKKTTPRCTQKYITKTVLEDTIENELKSVTVSQRFYDFALPFLFDRKTTKQESKEIIRQKKLKTGLQNRLAGLIVMRADGDITKEEFDTSKADIVQELATIETELLGAENLESIADTELIQMINLALLGLSKFKKDSQESKSNVLANFGSNLVLRDKKLIISKEKTIKWLKECEIEYRAKKMWLEPEKTVKNKALLSEYYRSHELLCSKLRAIRTLQKRIIQKRQKMKLKG